MSENLITSPKRRFWPPRFSLRALLILITLLCLVFAPVLPELNRTSRIAQQVKRIEEMGGQGVFVDRPQSFYARLVQRLWPVKIAHIEHDLLMAEFNEQTVDLAKLRALPDVRGVCFNECLFVLPEDEPDLRLPRIEYVQLQERDDVKGGKPDSVILRRFPAFFPKLRKATLMGVPQEQEFIDALAACERLEELDLCFNFETNDLHTAPLGQLPHLRRLRISGVSSTWNWAFVVHLEGLEEVEFGSETQPVGGYRYAFLTAPAEGMIYEPSYALTQLKRLRSVTLYEQGHWIPQLKQIAQSNDLESLHLHFYWSTIPALDALRNEASLRRLGRVVVGDDGAEVFPRLKRLPELRELECILRN
jgi:hypothetical protein